jgi:hypothetical protein
MGPRIPRVDPKQSLSRCLCSLTLRGFAATSYGKIHLRGGLEQVIAGEVC